MTCTPADEGSFAAIVVAAGSGARFGRSKHDLVLAGRPIWRWSVETFQKAGACEIIVVGDVPGGIPGGDTRRGSVFAGLNALTSEPPIVLVHDAARPLATVGLVEAVVAAVASGVAQGVIPALPVTDTIKRTDGACVVETVDRSDLVAVQTPQGFRTNALIDAHRSMPVDHATDDAGLVEGNGGTVVIVNGEAANLKITYPVDLAVAEAIVSAGRR